MKLTLIIGPTEAACARLRVIFKEKAKALAKAGVHAPDWNHVRLYAACADPDAVGVLRHRRGMDGPLVGRTLTREFEKLIAAEVAETDAQHFVVAAGQLGNLLHGKDELERLTQLLAPYFSEIHIVAHLAPQAELLLSHYTYAVLEGRTASLQAELDLVGAENWRDAALAARGDHGPEFGLFNDVQSPPFWLDYTRLLAQWEAAFGAGSVLFRPLDLPALMSPEGAQEVEALLDLKKPLGPVKPRRVPLTEPAVNLARMRQFNEVLIRYLKAHDISIPRDLWAQMLTSLRLPGPPIDPGSLAALSDHFAKDNAALTKRFPNLARLKPAPATSPWQEADPANGFRATQYLAAFAYGIKKHGTPLALRRKELADAQRSADKFDTLLGRSGADAQLLERVKVNHQMILSSPFRPHNNLGSVNEEELAAAFTPAPARVPAPGTTGRVIVGCMKNEAPYIIEWIAYHRAIGVDHFIIYTNGCDDTTDQILDRLQDMGVAQRRDNENWKGNSPQQHALNAALKEPLVSRAEWIAHIDVDEFINIRTGNGTLDDLFAAAPDATNFAMTWRLFGHNGVTELRDEFVIDQFDTCAPKYCPKPHTVWGYKSLFRNIGAYGKISCHRPNKLAEDFETRVKWVNGSGRDMTRDAAKNGWRSSKSNIGYDLVQLNHYALRSAESYLIKRQRGRALHVDRSIGLGYWIRMDWSDFRDITIKRNIPRVRAEYDRLMADAQLKQHHADGLAWHRAKAAELRATPEFAALYDQALGVKLNETERVAYALSLDMES
ncbi:MAG: glycosyltransferase family 2 protein [Pseudomonadota bacterium]